MASSSQSLPTPSSVTLISGIPSNLVIPLHAIEERAVDNAEYYDFRSSSGSIKRIPNLLKVYINYCASKQSVYEQAWTTVSAIFTICVPPEVYLAKVFPRGLFLEFSDLRFDTRLSNVSFVSSNNRISNPVLKSISDQLSK